ncbi:diguanylate cyclase (GGDEF)-like protein [Sulfitobacter undariae]|uniref:Diguanylate cyclase (GGDEF)-like protein n=1 Tax=Sulfitobacter undariae TaxID=1563671 RepID=A0A7W6E3T9_9RHOB|nr:GGDEF domain-containing protein [Sulfitobacter undariae]MBB3992936.1 diguanylate cyclase (GGDEF)-like protein [Sulfitobacter undariae]
MHLTLDAQGRIAHVGPTTKKLRPDMPLVGQLFLDVFQVKRPREISNLKRLREVCNTKLHLEMKGKPPARLKGVLVSCGDGTSIVNLSFGISIMEGVRDYTLTNTDFAVTDLAIEMLYLVEAKTAAMEASRKLNLRLQGAKQMAEEAARTDMLTGLRNRRALDQLIEQLLGAHIGFGVMHIDLDHFKTVNDTLGHAAGDYVLKVAAAAMVEETRATDTVARVGGDEFTVILPEVADIDVLAQVGRRIIDRIKMPVQFNGSVCQISASIGTVWIQGSDGLTRETVMENADIALYASKSKGRSRQTFYSHEMRGENSHGSPFEQR